MAARIVTLDIETAPIKSYHWGLKDQNIGLEQIDLDWSILSVSWKWLDSPKVEFLHTGGRGARKVRDDRAVLKALWGVLDEADIVVGQNAQAFDIKKINARLITHGFKPYSPIRVVDTLLIAKRRFEFTSNRLAWTSRLVKTQKDAHREFPGFELWAECLKDNPKAWAEMKAYNQIDVLATEQLYLKFRPWIDNHPNVSAYGGVGRSCPKCGSPRLRSNGLRHNQAGAYRRLLCLDCGGWASERENAIPSVRRRALLAGQ